ncbi:MAG: hypothetical protein ACUVQ8_05915 [Nitrososphaeria archaeon]
MSVQLFDETEATKTVDEIVGKVQYVNRISEQAYKSIQDALKKSLEKSRVVVPVADPSRVILRATTIQTLLDGVKDHVGANLYGRLLRGWGEEVGVSFGHILIETLKQKRRLPKTYKTILVVWTIFDSSARWGDIKVNLFDETKQAAEVKIVRNFLTTGYEHDIHRHCPFFEGYIQGVTTQAFMEWTRWFNSISPTPTKTLLCESITESQHEANCVFRMKFKVEGLETACDRLAESFRAHDNGRWEESMRLSRESLETALRDKIGAKEKRFNFAKAIRAFSDVGKTLASQDKALEVYSLAGEAIDQKLERKISSEDSHKMAVFARKFITELEGISLTKEQRNHIKASIKTP